MMKRITQIALIAMIALTAASCKGKKDENAAITDKKAAIEKLKASNAKNADELRKLQDELAKIDTATANATKIKLVSVAPVTVQDFTHYIDLQGKVDADNISYISPRGMAGQVKGLYVKQGDAVRKGQLLVKLDDAVQRQAVVVARQQLQSIRTQLTYNENIANRYQQLWSQGIGTEVQLIQAKTQVQGSKDQLASANEMVNAAVQQLNLTSVYSDVNGVADIVNVRVGETFTGQTANGPQIKIVNTSSLKVTTSIPENYISRLHKGSPAEVTVTDINKVIKAPVSLLSQSVDPANRGFMADIKIPYDPLLKPNQAAKIRITDYTAAGAVVIPVNTVQTDETGKYVYVLEKTSNGKTVARKKTIVLGEVYGNNAEVKTGLSAGEQLITEGYQGIYEGQNITTEVK